MVEEVWQMPPPDVYKRQAYNYYVKEALNFPNYYNGLIRAGIGLITLVMTVTIGTWIAKKFDLRDVYKRQGPEPPACRAGCRPCTG